VHGNLDSAGVSVGTLSAEARSRPAASQRVLALASPVLALTALAAALRFVGLAHQGFWFDEGNTALLVHLPPGKMLGLIPQSESTPPLYYCVAWVWARIFGFGEAGLRSLSAVAGVATVPVAYGAARKLVSERAGLVAAALVACNPFLIWYSQEARSYSLLVFLTAAALMGFAYARKDPTARALVAWVVPAAAALATHYYAILAIIPQAVWLLSAHGRRRRVQVAVAIVAACGLALIPLALSQNSTGNAGWIAKISLGPRLGQIIPQFVIGTGSPAYAALEPLAAAMVVVALVLLMTRGNAGERGAALRLGALAISGLVINLVLVAIGIDDLITRNVIALWLPVALVVATGLAVARGSVVGLLATAVLCGTGVAAAVGVASDRTLQRPDWRGVARVMGAQAPPGGRAILVQHYRDLLPLSLYMHGMKFWRHSPTQTVSELDVVAISAPRERLCWWGAACNLSGSPIQSSYPVPGFREVSLRHAYQFTVMRLVAARPVTLSRAAVARALSATTLPRDELLIQR